MFSVCKGSKLSELTIKKAEHRRIDAFEPWCWRRLLRVPWAAKRSNQPILKEIDPEYSLEGLLLKLKLQYFGHLMWRTDSLEKTLMLGKIEGRRRRGWQRMRGWMASLSRWTWVWASSGRWWWTVKCGMLQSMGSQRVRHDWVTEQQPQCAMPKFGVNMYRKVCAHIFRCSILCPNLTQPATWRREGQHMSGLHFHSLLWTTGKSPWRSPPLLLIFQCTGRIT